MFAMQIATGSLAKIYIHPWTHFTHDATGESGVDSAGGTAMVVTIIMFVVAFAFSWGPLGWLVCTSFLHVITATILQRLLAHIGRRPTSPALCGLLPCS